MTTGRRVAVALLTILPLAVTPARATYVSFHAPSHYFFEKRALLPRHQRRHPGTSDSNTASTATHA